MVALAVYGVAEIFSVAIFRATEGRSYLAFVIFISIKTILFWWLVPLLIVYKLENRDIQSLGLVVPRNKYLAYFFFAVAALIFPIVIVGYRTHYPMEFIEQILYIGFSEEVFYRGFIMTRMCQWLGKYKGLLVASLLFGLGHIISRVADLGIGFLIPGTYIALQALFGGLIFGYIYIRTNNIWPSGILHVSANMYFQDLIAVFRV